MPAADPALPRQPDVVEPVARGLVQPAVVITASVCRQVAAETTRSRVSGLTPPSARVAPITARSRAVTLRRALPRVEVDRLDRVAAEAAMLVERARELRLRWFVSDAERVDLSSSASASAGEAESPSWTKRPALVGVAPGDEARRGDRTRVDHRVRAAVALRSTASSELNGSPVALTPTAARISRARARRRRARTRTASTTLMIVNSSSASPTAWTSPLVATTQIPKGRAARRASAGYTADVSRPCSPGTARSAASTSARTSPAAAAARSRRSARPRRAPSGCVTVEWSSRSLEEDEPERRSCRRQQDRRRARTRSSRTARAPASSAASAKITLTGEAVSASSDAATPRGRRTASGSSSCEGDVRQPERHQHQRPGQERCDGAVDR